MYPKAPTNLGHSYAFRGQFVHVVTLGAGYRARPLYLPSRLALAMPSRWRSSIISRSN
jgi:hypothetical protein